MQEQHKKVSDPLNIATIMFTFCEKNFRNQKLTSSIQDLVLSWYINLPDF